MEWPVVSIGEVSRIVSGSTPRTGVADYWNGDIPWVTPKDLSSLKTMYISEATQRITDSGFKNCSTVLLPTGSVLLSSRAPIGYVAINSVPMCTNQGFKSLIPDPTRLSAEFLCFWLRAHRSYLESLGNGATFKELSKATVERIKIPLPPLPEQRRIAAILDTADALRRKRREAMARLDDLLQSVFLEMFGDPAAGDWPRVTVDDVAAPARNAIRTGPFGSQLLHSEFVDSGIAVLGIDNAVQNTFNWGERRFITREKYQRLQRYRVSPGDVIITIMGTCGRCAVVPDDIPLAINTKHLCCITLDQSKCLPVFLHSCFLQHPAIRRQLRDATKGAIMDGLNMGIIKSLSFPLPPLRLQEKYAAVVHEVSVLKGQAMESERRLGQLFSALQERTFRGQSLRGWSPPGLDSCVAASTDGETIPFSRSPADLGSPE